MRRVALAGVALFLLSSAAHAADTAEHIDRLAHLGKLGGTVREAKTSEEYKTAVQGMLGALGDPVTRVADPLPPEAPEPPPAGKAELGMDSYYVQQFLEELSIHLVSRPVQAAPERYLIHSGYRPQTGPSATGTRSSPSTWERWRRRRPPTTTR